ncbi:MAG TPA: cupredoxin domain-containing protein [Baekduia sp.]|uniref:cupredoxin domain-containing protein n=1 Tax=Baekduia sp. TaxID=2600305 RepID=UPI002D790F59|nr:cupredoxin domain-containing protein [Baekduia sp.]HET6509443.1 cupredoxin domain-containing protein [Baekduia sp.]
MSSKAARRGAAGAAILAAAAAAVVPAAVAQPHKTKPKAKTHQVGVNDDYYDPTKLTLHAGDKVKWVWHSSGFNLHDVYVDSGPTDFHSPTQGAGSYSYTFKKAGTYKLYCSQHQAVMTMTVVVKKAAK